MTEWSVVEETDLGGTTWFLLARDSVPTGARADTKRLAEEMAENAEANEVSSDPDTMRALADAERSISEGDVVRGRDAIRALLDERCRACPKVD